jgi:hypothetical protein
LRAVLFSRQRSRNGRKRKGGWAGSLASAQL